MHQDSRSRAFRFFLDHPVYKTASTWFSNMLRILFKFQYIVLNHLLPQIEEQEHVPSSRLMSLFPDKPISAQWKTSGHIESAQSAARVVVKRQY